MMWVSGIFSLVMAVTFFLEIDMKPFLGSPILTNFLLFVVICFLWAKFTEDDKDK
jgi:hypothetical protein